MKIAIACDHAGYNLKIKIIEHFSNLEFKDFGCNNAHDSVDYPDIAQDLCQNYLKSDFDFGILICGSGIGVSIAANRFNNIRAALCHNEQIAKLSRQHNNANILCLGARIIDEKTAFKIIDTFLKEKAQDGRHNLRIEKLG